MIGCVRRPILWCGLAVTFLLAGCNRTDLPKTAPAKGKVTYNGEPLGGASVTFTPTKGASATGQTDAQGEFTLRTFGANDGAIPGSHVVTVAKMESPAVSGDPGRAPPSNTPPKSLIPTKYNDTKASGLTATVTPAGPNEFTFDLKD